ncbi:MAG: hypothetical protein RLZZ453_310 [Chlamydiota bacterium]
MSISNSVRFNHFCFTSFGSSNSIAGTICNVAYDVFVKNVYELTIGNAKRILFTPAPFVEKIKGSAIFLFGVCYSFTLYGASVYCTGQFLTGLGSRVSLLYLPKIGSAVAAVGEKLFLAGAVPLYGICYALPKKIIDHFPDIFHFVAKQTARVAQSTIDYIIIPLWNHLISPVMKLIFKTIRIIAEIAEPVVDKLVDISSWLFKIFFRNVVRPIWTYVTVPVCKLTYRVILVTKKTADVLFDKVEKVVVWALKTIIWPSIQLVARISLKIERALEGVILPVIRSVHAVFMYGMDILGRMGTNLGAKIAVCAQYVFATCIVPVAQVVSRGFAAVAEKTYSASSAILTGIDTVWKNTSAFF